MSKNAPRGRARWFAIVATAALIVTACSGSTASVAPSAAHQPVTLKAMFWHSEDAYQNEVKLFQEKYPWITVEYEAVPYDDFFPKLTAYAAAGDGPDVAGLVSGWIYSLKDSLQPLNDDVKDLLPTLNGTQDYCLGFDCTNNKVLGVGFSMQGLPLYYNIEVLKAAGLDPAKPPATWRDMAAACEKIKAIGKTCWANGAKDFGDDIIIGALYLQTHTYDELVGYTTGATKYNGAALVNALGIYEDMVKRGWFATTALEDRVYPEAQTLFTTGQAAFFGGLISDAYNWKVLGDAMGYDKFGAMIYPQIEKDFPLQGVTPGPLANTLANSAASGFGIPTWSKQKEAALLWIRWWVSPDTQARMAVAGGTWPTLKDVDTSAVTAPQFKQLVPFANGAKAGGIGAFMPEKAIQELGPQLQLLLQGKVTPADAAQKVQEASER